MSSEMKKAVMPLYQNMALEWACAVSASFTVAPVISIVDRSIIENASGKMSLLQSMKSGFIHLFTSPLSFARQPAFLLIWGVYAGTYIVGNTIDMACQRHQRSSFIPKFVGSSAANVTLSVMKDEIYTKMFGSGQSQKRFPRTSYMLFGTRDSLTILSGFSLPPSISEWLQKDYGWHKSRADLCSQLFAPCIMQIFSTPLHLTGIDLYNRPGVSTSERIKLIKEKYVATVSGRIGRIFPAFGVGGVLNKKLRAMIYSQ